MQKVFAANRKFGKIRAESWWDDHGMNSDATAEQQRLFGKSKLFTHPKPAVLIYNLIKIATEKDSIILDFFSGSATTAHAVMQLNAEDGGTRKYILIQLPEVTDKSSEAFQCGYNNICDLAKDRIRKAGDIIVTNIEKYGRSIPRLTKASTKQTGPVAGVVKIIPWHDTTAEEFAEFKKIAKELDTGFRVFKLDDSNMTDVFYAAGEYTQAMLEGLESNIKSDRTDLDLLFGCLLEWGLPLSMPYTSEQIDGCTVHTYNGGDLIACFDENIPDSVIKTIAKRQPLRAVFRDSSFADSPSKINVGEIFKMLAPDTRVKVV